MKRLYIYALCLGTTIRTGIRVLVEQVLEAVK